MWANKYEYELLAAAASSPHWSHSIENCLWEMKCAAGVIWKRWTECLMCKTMYAWSAAATSQRCCLEFISQNWSFLSCPRRCGIDGCWCWRQVIASRHVDSRLMLTKPGSVCSTISTWSNASTQTLWYWASKSMTVIIITIDVLVHTTGFPVVRVRWDFYNGCVSKCHGPRTRRKYQNVSSFYSRTRIHAAWWWPYIVAGRHSSLSQSRQIACTNLFVLRYALSSISWNYWRQFFLINSFYYNSFCALQHVILCAS